MGYAIGAKISFNINGSDTPGVVIGEPVRDDRFSRNGGNVLAFRQEVVSMKTPPTTGISYLDVGYENTSPRFMSPRRSTVEGLDAIAGTPITLDALLGLVRQANDEFSRERALTPTAANVNLP